MASYSTRPNGRQHVFFSFHGKRHTVRLGLVDKTFVEEFVRRLERLIDTKKAGLSYDTEQRLWLQTLSPGPHNTLARAGLIVHRGATTLQELVDLYMQRLIAASSKPATIANSQVVIDNLVEFFGGTKHIASLTFEDAANWREKLLKIGTTDYGPLAEVTVSRRCRKARTVFKIAVEEQWIERNPFARVKVTGGVNTSRDVYVERETVEKLIQASPEPEFRLLLAITRYCGLRCPSEIHPLKWEWFDWELGTFMVYSPKTEHHEGKAYRTIPIPEELAQYALEAWEAALTGQELVFPNHQMTGAAITGKVQRLCNKLGIEKWKKTFTNMRASCERDLFIARYPIDEISAWMGHKPEIALRHYSRVEKELKAQKAGRALRANRGVKKAKQNQTRIDRYDVTIDNSEDSENT